MKDTLSIEEVLLRVGMAFIAGFVVGLERESHGRAAGLRTTTIVSVASAIAMILSEYFFLSGADITTWRPDPARLAAGVLTGMGFLGAGSIIRQENVIRGVTTAAVLWFVTVLGLAFGSGHFVLGLIGMGVALVTLFVLPPLENHVKSDWYGTVTITVELGGVPDEEIRKHVEASGVKIKKISLDYDRNSKQKTLFYDIRFKKGDHFELSQKLVRELAEVPSVLQVKWM